MAHSFITTRMVRHPGAHIQDFVVHDDNSPAIGDLAFNLPTTENSSFPLCLRVHSCGVKAGEATQSLNVRFEMWQEEKLAKKLQIMPETSEQRR
jgi:hypothetical protein